MYTPSERPWEKPIPVYGVDRRGKKLVPYCTYVAKFVAVDSESSTSLGLVVCHFGSFTAPIGISARTNKTNDDPYGKQVL